MSSKRKFYREVFQIEVLSESPIEEEEFDLRTILYNITEGHWSGMLRSGEAEEVDGPAMAKYLLAQGSDPEFFNLTEDGEDADEVAG